MSNGDILWLLAFDLKISRKPAGGGVPIVLSRGVRPFDGRFWQC